MRLGAGLSYLKERILGFFRDENLSLRFLALGIAIVLWFFAGGNTPIPPTERIISLNVTLMNLPSDLSLVGASPTIRVRVAGPEERLEGIERESRAFVDLTDAIEGDATYEVSVFVPAGVEVLSLTPRWLALSIEPIIEREYPIRMALIGVMPRVPVLGLSPEPLKVRARAPRSLHQSIHQVVTYITLEENVMSLQGDFLVTALDVNARALDRIQFYPEKVRVTVRQLPDHAY